MYENIPIITFAMENEQVDKTNNNKVLDLKQKSLYCTNNEKTHFYY